VYTIITGEFFRCKSFILTNINTSAISVTHAGINITESFGTTIGQFILMTMQGALPDEDGWDIGNRVARGPKCEWLNSA